MDESTDASMSSSLLPSQTSIPPELIEKQQWIQDLIAKDRAAFDEWTANPKNAPRLDMPHNAMRYFLIPSKLLEIVADPSKVDVKILTNFPERISSVVYVQKDEPVTNLESLNRYVQAMNEFKKRGDSKNMPFPKIPPDVDYLHAHFARMGHGNKFDFKEFIINEMNLSSFSRDILHVDSYDNRNEFNNRGIATSFYNRLHESAKKMHYRYITGFNNPDNVTFFTNKLGRVPLDQIPRMKRSHFSPSSIEEDNPQHFTIDFLYPEDKAKYVGSPKK